MSQHAAMHAACRAGHAARRPSAPHPRTQAAHVVRKQRLCQSPPAVCRCMLQRPGLREALQGPCQGVVLVLAGTHVHRGLICRGICDAAGGAGLQPELSALRPRRAIPLALPAAPPALARGGGGGEHMGSRPGGSWPSAPWAAGMAICSPAVPATHLNTRCGLLAAASAPHAACSGDTDGWTSDCSSARGERGGTGRHRASVRPPGSQSRQPAPRACLCSEVGAGPLPGVRCGLDGRQNDGVSGRGRGEGKRHHGQLRHRQPGRQGEAPAVPRASPRLPLTARSRGEV